LAEGIPGQPLGTALSAALQAEGSTGAAPSYHPALRPWQKTKNKRKQNGKTKRTTPSTNNENLKAARIEGELKSCRDANSKVNCSTHAGRQIKNKLQRACKGVKSRSN